MGDDLDCSSGNEEKYRTHYRPCYRCGRRTTQFVEESMFGFRGPGWSWRGIVVTCDDCEPRKDQDNDVIGVPRG